MEFEDVRKEYPWEARRVAAAFGVEIAGVHGYFYVADTGTTCIDWDCRESFFHIGIYEKDMEEGCSLWRHSAKPEWVFSLGYKPHGELMVRGLYRLGFKDEGVLSQLPTLSAHEKLELRLSLPREFWPKTWLEEQEQEAGK